MLLPRELRMEGFDWLCQFVRPLSRARSMEHALASWAHGDVDRYRYALWETCGVIQCNGKESSCLEPVYVDTLWSHPMFATLSQMEQEEMEFATNPVQVEDGVLQCYRCKSYRTYSYQRQTRSADEMATTFATCVDCGNRWRNS